MKKKILALLLMFALVFGVTACGTVETNNDVSDDIVDEDEDEDADVNEDEDADEDADVNEGEDTDNEDEVAESEGVLVFDVPEGFVWDEESNAYKSVNENEVANINSLANPNDGSFASTTQSMMEEALEDTLSEVYGETLDLTVTKWDSIKVDGYDAISYEIQYEVSGVAVIQKQVIVDGTEQLHFVTFTYLKDEGYDDIFANCINSLRFE